MLIYNMPRENLSGAGGGVFGNSRAERVSVSRGRRIPDPRGDGRQRRGRGAALRVFHGSFRRADSSLGRAPSFEIFGDLEPAAHGGVDSVLAYRAAASAWIFAF